MNHDWCSSAMHDSKRIDSCRSPGLESPPQKGTPACLQGQRRLMPPSQGCPWSRTLASHQDAGRVAHPACVEQRTLNNLCDSMSSLLQISGLHLKAVLYIAAARRCDYCHLAVYRKFWGTQFCVGIRLKTNQKIEVSACQ